MTLVVTERHGVVAIFSKLADGTMKQRGLLDVEESEATHLELATFAEGLSTTFGWNGVDVAPTQPVKRKAVGAAKRKALPPGPDPDPTAETSTRKARKLGPSRVPKGYRDLPRGSGANALRPAMITEAIEFVRANPGATVASISNGTRIYDRTVANLMTRPEVLEHIRVERENPTSAKRFYAKQ